MPEHEETNSEAHYDYHDGHFDYHRGGRKEAPARHQRDTNSETQYDYDYSEGQAESEYSGDSEDEEVSSFRAQFVSKDKSETKVKRGRTAILECAVKRWNF